MRSRSREIRSFFLLMLVSVGLGVWAFGECAGPEEGQAGRPLASQRPCAQEEPSPEIITLRSDLVLVTVNVRGERGEWLTGLGPEDFEILEEGIPQPIAFFSRDASLPLRLVVVFDTSLSVKNRLEFQKQVIARFLRAIMRPSDRAALISVSTEAVLRQGFTSDVSQLVMALRALRSEGATALYEAIAMAAEYVGGQSIPHDPKDSAKDVTEGRRVLLIISDGRDTVSRIPFAQAVRRAQEIGATVYAICVGESESANIRELIGETALEALVRQTGGEMFSPQRPEELEPVFARLAEQLRTQYVLGFYSPAEARAGTFRRVLVRIKRPGAMARARDGYYVPKR